MMSFKIGFLKTNLLLKKKKKKKKNDYEILSDFYLQIFVKVTVTF